METKEESALECVLLSLTRKIWGFYLLFHLDL